MADRLKHLKTLGLPPSASDDDIKKAYKKLALQFHPDKNDSEDANAKFQEISNAYQFLTEGGRRGPVLEDDVRCRQDFFRQMFQGLFVPPQFFFHRPGPFPFFFEEDVYDDEDYYYYSGSSDDDWVPGGYNSYSREESNRYKFNYTNKQPGPEMSAKQLRKKEKRRKQRARDRERKANKGNVSKPSACSDDINDSNGGNSTRQRERKANNGNVSRPSAYSDDINDSKGGNSESKAENSNLRQPNQSKTSREKQEHTGVKPGPGATQNPEAKANTERSSTPVRNEQQRANKSTKKKMESDQRKREREMEEIAAELRRQQEEKQEKQRRKEEQERLQKEKEKTSSTHFEPFTEFYDTDSKSRRRRRGKKKEEEEEETVQRDEPKEHRKLPTDDKNKLYMNSELNQPKTSPYGPIGSKIPAPGAASGQRGQTNTYGPIGSKIPTSSKTQYTNGHSQGEYGKGQGYMGSGFGQAEVPGAACGQRGQAYTGFSQSQTRQQTYNKPSPAAKLKEPGSRSSQAPRTRFSQFNQFDILDVSDEDSLEDQGGLNSCQSANSHIGQSKTSPGQTYYQKQQQQQQSYNPNPYANSYSASSAEPSRNSPYGQEHKPHSQSYQYGHTTPDPNQNSGFNRSSSPDRNMRNHYHKEYTDTYCALDDIDESGFGNTLLNSMHDTFIRQEYNIGTNNSREMGTNSSCNNGNQQTVFNKPTDKKEKSNAHGRQNFPLNAGNSKQQHFSKPFSSNNIRPSTPVFGNMSTPPPSNGQAPSHAGVGSQTYGQRGFDKRDQYPNYYNRPPGFAMNGAPQRPKAFSDSGYHAIGKTGNNSYENAQTTGGQFSSYNINRKTTDSSHINGFREGPNLGRGETLPKSKNNSRVDSLPSWQCYASPSASADSPVLSSSRNSIGSLDSLDDFLAEPPVATNSPQDKYDLSHLETRFEGVVGREELGVPKAMFSDNIKNYYR